MKAFLGTGGGEVEGGREGSVQIGSDNLRYTPPGGSLILTPEQRRNSRVYWTKPVTGQEVPCNLDYDDAITATGVPQVGDVLNGVTAIGATAKEINSLEGVWKVTVFWDKHPPVPQDLIWHWDDETVEKVIEKDPITLGPIINAVGEPLFITSPTTVQILTIERAEWQTPQGTNATQMPTKTKNRLYANRVNRYTFWGYPPKTALMHSIRDAPLYRNGAAIRRVVYVIKFDMSTDAQGNTIGWMVELLNHGSKHKVLVDTVLPDGRTIPPSDQFQSFRDGEKTISTGNLNLDGTYRSPLLAPVYLPYNRFPWTDFGPLDLEVLVF